jgi:23S rRNA (pseudouridine1915-N3)-methyltransferase
LAKLHLIKLGKPAFSEYSSLTSTYLTRIQSFVSVEQTIIKEHDHKNVPARVLKQLGIEQNSSAHCDHMIICLDERGEELSSKSLSIKLEQWLSLSKTLHLVVGGAYGIPPQIIERSQHKICLSKMTLTSDCAWLLLHEQVYRALTILRGVPYHHA